MPGGFTRGSHNVAAVSAPVLIGLDVGTTNLKGVCFTATGESLVRLEAQTPRMHPRQAYRRGQARYNRVRENVRLLAQELYAH